MKLFPAVTVSGCRSIQLQVSCCCLLPVLWLVVGVIDTLYEFWTCCDSAFTYPLPIRIKLLPGFACVSSTTSGVVVRFFNHTGWLLLSLTVLLSGCLFQLRCIAVPEPNFTLRLPDLSTRWLCLLPGLLRTGHTGGSSLCAYRCVRHCRPGTAVCLQPLQGLMLQLLVLLIPLCFPFLF